MIFKITSAFPPIVSIVPRMIFQSTFSFKNSIDKGIVIRGPEAAIAAGVEVPVNKSIDFR